MIRASGEEYPIIFHTEELDFELSNPELIRIWIADVVKKEGQQLQLISYIFCSDAYLHKINLQFLQHDTFTDIITFPYAYNPIEADIFISIDRIKENAKIFATKFELELCRVMIHGVLHLLGYRDKTKSQKAIMTRRENEYLELLNLYNS